MIIEYTGRQTVVTQKYKDQAGAGMRRIEKLIHGPASAKVVLTVDKYRMLADVAVTHGRQSMVAECESADMMTALRHAIEKIEHQAKRYRQKTTTTMRHPRPVMMDATAIA
jgi:putative sigma-54 modulation protein